ncbi:MAG TPA: redoxin domain-containing protein [Planctomycetes bacterium]|nr:redoxin domain-containing protein [Planctomycetaceae bacterium]HIM28942.1 redoxin domain-containing protein [Planctomycetota bacterium]
MSKAICLVSLMVASVAAPITSVHADVREDVTKIMTAARAGDLDLALKTFEASLKNHPKDARLRSQATLLWSYLSRANRHEDAGRLVDEFLSWAVDNERYNVVPSAVSRLSTTRQKLNSTKQFQQTLRNYSASLSKKENIDAVSAWASMTVILAKADVAEERNDEAANRFQPVVARARKLCIGHEEEPRYLRVLTSTLSDYANLVTDNNQQNELNAEAFKILRQAIDKKVPQFESLLMPLASKFQLQISQLSANNDFSGAEKLLAELNSVIESLEQDVPIRKSLERTTASIESRLAAARKHFELIGKRAFPLEVVSWVNGEPLADDDLRGKVVILDFWAVWCGPCIATFPHLREWHEKYAEKGLVIIGVTRYYNYGWDAEAKRASRQNAISQSDEEKAMVEFAVHHELKHRFAIQPSGSEFSKLYGVRGIPQAVVIDREGKIRMIKVGSGSKNSDAIDELLAELFGNDAT